MDGQNEQAQERIHVVVNTCDSLYGPLCVYLSLSHAAELSMQAWPVSTCGNLSLLQNTLLKTALLKTALLKPALSKTALLKSALQATCFTVM